MNHLRRLADRLDMPMQAWALGLINVRAACHAVEDCMVDRDLYTIG